MMKKILLSLAAALSLMAGMAQASSGNSIPWDKFPAERVNDKAAVQNGAKLFVNYCLNCHAAEFNRYNRLRDVGLSEEQIKDNLVFTGAKVGDTMKVALDPKQAKDWFGATPPDLTVIARSRSAAGQGSGADYIYTYLRSYYVDESRPTGWNNAAFPNVGMPNVLWELQGLQRAVYKEVADAHDPAKTQHVYQGLETIRPGSMTTADFNTNVADLVAYMQWMAEPQQSNRVRLGVWVLLFLGIFTVIAWRLNASFWKDIK